MNMKYTVLAVAVVSVLAIGHGAMAAVSADEAAKLKTSLTPLGAEKAGNADGTIPAWSGVIPKSTGKLPKGYHLDLFPNEKPVVQITGQNYTKYADKLSEGTIALLKKYPTYRVDVYPTHRTAVAPQYIYDNTFKNATRATLIKDGQSVEGAYGGVPFPIPKIGSEVIWNHILHPRVISSEFGFKSIVGSSDGRRTISTRADNNNQSPYYMKDGSVEKWNGDYIDARFVNTDPPFKAGEALVIRDNIDPSNARQAWQYLVGQRRVRRSPTVAYDTPDFVSSGVDYFDEVIGFYGHPDRYEWKIVGKKEVYIPYNTNKFLTTTESEAFVANHPNPDKVRWELHRVWVVDATVAPGKRHAVPKRRYYFDEDTWAVSMIDGYDAEGKLWRNSYVLPYVNPDYPITVSDTVVIHNLQASTYVCVQCFNDEYWRASVPKPDSFFTGDALGSSGLR